MDLIGNWSSKSSHTSHLAPYMAFKYGHMIHLNHFFSEIIREFDLTAFLNF